MTHSTLTDANRDVRLAIGHAVKYFRRYIKDWSQEALAASVGVDRQTINRLENGHHMPTADNLVKIILSMEVPLERFFAHVDQNLKLFMER